MKQFIVVLMLLCAGMSALAVTPDNPVKEDRGRGRGKCLVKGKVIVKGSKEELPYATVQIIGLDGGVVTNEHGEFEINHLGKGRPRQLVRTRRPPNPRPGRAGRPAVPRHAVIL